MIQKIQDHVYRVHKPDLRLHMNDLFDEICRMHMTDFSYSFITSRTDHRINGYQDIVDSVANDYRSHALLIVTPAPVTEPAECECAE